MATRRPQRKPIKTTIAPQEGGDVCALVSKWPLKAMPTLHERVDTLQIAAGSLSAGTANIVEAADTTTITSSVVAGFPVTTLVATLQESADSILLGGGLRSAQLALAEAGDSTALVAKSVASERLNLLEAADSIAVAAGTNRLAQLALADRADSTAITAVGIQPPSQDWVTRSAGRLFARRLASADALDANMAGRHPTAQVGLWLPTTGYNAPVIDGEGLRFDVLTGFGIPDWYAAFGQQFGANSTLYIQWRQKFNQAFISTVFRTAGGGYPGIKLAVISCFTGTSCWQKLVVSTLDQHKFPFLYQYSESGNTENLSKNIGNPPTDFDWEPKVGITPTCKYTVNNATPQGQPTPGCANIPADVWVTFDVELITGGLIAGTNTWHARRKLYMTVGNTKSLVVDYDDVLTPGPGRNAGPIDAIWFGPYMTDRDGTQTFPVTPSTWYKEVIVDDQPIPAVLETPSTLPSYVPAVGTFAEFTLNRPIDVPTVTAAIFDNWCGGAFINEYSTRGGVAYHGGGEHFSWPDKGGVLMLNCDTRLYEMRCSPAIQTHMGCVIAGSPGGLFVQGSPTNQWGAYVDDDYPQMKHTYNCLEEMPAAWGGGPRGSLVRVAHTGGDSTAAVADGLSSTYRFDLSQAINGHSRLTGTQVYNFGNPLKSATVHDSIGTGKDTLRQGWWAFARTGSGHGDRMVFTHKSGAIAPAGAPTTPAIGLNWGQLHHFVDNDSLCALASGIHIHQIGSATWSHITNYTGAAATLSLWNTSAPYLGYIGLKWSTILGCFVGIDFSADSHIGGPNTVRVWRVTPPPMATRLTAAWSVVLETLTSADGSVIDVRSNGASVNGAWGKLVECPSLRAFVWSRGAGFKGQLFRLQGMG